VLQLSAWLDQDQYISVNYTMGRLAQLLQRKQDTATAKAMSTEHLNLVKKLADVTKSMCNR
jgi:hypothetical protein